MTRRVVIVGMYAPYLGPFDGVEVWGVNHVYERQPNLARLYFFDALEAMKERDPDFVSNVNGLAIPVYTKRHYPEIPLSEPFPKAELPGHDYFTSSIAYMLAHAIHEGVDEITVHRILVGTQSIDYWLQKACFDYWVGQALGRGIRVRISEDSLIAKPAPWEPGAYGYAVNRYGDSANEIIVSGFRAAALLPIDMQPVMN